MRYQTRIFLFFLLIYGTPLFLDAKYTITKERDYLEIGAGLSVFFNYRFYPGDAVDRDKNRFKLEEASVQFKGLFRRIFLYELQIDFSKFVTDRLTRSDIEPLIKDAYITVASFLNVTMGYHKLPYSRNSLGKAKYSAFLERPDMIDKAMYRRDVGVSVSRTLFRQRVNLYAGLYNGTGKVVKNTDPSGLPEYCARLDLSYPLTYDYNEVDLGLSPILMLSAGANIRYVKKNEDVINDPDDNYPLMVDGRKYTYGFDFSAQYRGLSLQIEGHQIRGYFQSQSRSLFVPSLYDNYPLSYFLTGGIFSQLNFYCKPLSSVFAVRYEELNPNHLVMGDIRRSVTGAYCLLFDAFNSVLRIQFSKRLKEKRTGLPWKNDELRVGYQVLI